MTILATVLDRLFAPVPPASPEVQMVNAISAALPDRIGLLRLRAVYVAQCLHAHRTGSTYGVTDFRAAAMGAMDRRLLGLAKRTRVQDGTDLPPAAAQCVRDALRLASKGRMTLHIGILRDGGAWACRFRPSFASQLPISDPRRFAFREDVYAGPAIDVQAMAAEGGFWDAQLAS